MARVPKKVLELATRVTSALEPTAIEFAKRNEKYARATESAARGAEVTDKETARTVAGRLPEGARVSMRARPEIGMGYWGRRRAKKLEYDRLLRAIEAADASRKDRYLTRKERRKAQQDYNDLTKEKDKRDKELKKGLDYWRNYGDDDR